MRKYEDVSKSDYAHNFRSFRHTKRLSCPKTALNKIKQLRRGGKSVFSFCQTNGVSCAVKTPRLFLCHIPINSAIFSLTTSAAWISDLSVRCVYLFVIVCSLCPSSPAMIASEYPKAAAMEAKLCRKA